MDVNRNQDLAKKLKSDAKGHESERRTHTLCEEKLEARELVNFWPAPRGSNWDRSGYDFLLALSENPQVVFPLQVKSSWALARQHQEIRPDVPYIVAGPQISDDDARKQFDKVIEEMRRELSEPTLRGNRRIRRLRAPRKKELAAVEFDEVVARALRILSDDEESPCVLSYFAPHNCSASDKSAMHCTLITSLGELVVVLLYKEMPLEERQPMKARRRPCDNPLRDEAHLFVSLPARNVDKAQASKKLVERIKRIITEVEGKQEEELPDSEEEVVDSE